MVIHQNSTQCTFVIPVTHGTKQKQNNFLPLQTCFHSSCPDLIWEKHANFVSDFHFFFFFFFLHFVYVITLSSKCKWDLFLFLVFCQSLFPNEYRPVKLCKSSQMLVGCLTKLVPDSCLSWQGRSLVSPQVSRMLATLAQLRMLFAECVGSLRFLRTFPPGTNLHTGSHEYFTKSMNISGLM